MMANDRHYMLNVIYIYKVYISILVEKDWSKKVLNVNKCFVYICNFYVL